MVEILFPNLPAIGIGRRSAVHLALKDTVDVRTRLLHADCGPDSRDDTNPPAPFIGEQTRVPQSDRDCDVNPISSLETVEVS